MAQGRAPGTSTGVGGGVGDSSGEKDVYQYSARSLRLKTTEEELFELVGLSEVPVDKELFKVILELLKLNVAPAAILQVLKTLRAQATHSSLPPSLHSSRAASRSHSPAPVRSTTQTQNAPVTQADQPPTQAAASDRTDQAAVGGRQPMGGTRSGREREKPTGGSKAERSTLKPSAATGSSSKTSSRHLKGAKQRTGYSSRTASQPKS